METILLWATADGEGAGGLNLSPSILSDIDTQWQQEVRSGTAYPFLHWQTGMTFDIEPHDSAASQTLKA